MVSPGRRSGPSWLTGSTTYVESIWSRPAGAVQGCDSNSAPSERSRLERADGPIEVSAVHDALDEVALARSMSLGEDCDQRL